MTKQKFDFSAFKRDINLAAFAADYGYAIDRNKSTKTSFAMKSANDKIIITKKQGIWVYFSVADEADSGTVVDFVEKRTQKSIVEIGHLLSEKIGTPPPIIPAYEIEKRVIDQDRVKRIFAKCKPARSCDYLKSRGLEGKLLRSDRFSGRVFVDYYGNIAFPHFRNRDVCALELKNRERGILVKGSQKTFWRSNSNRSDSTIVVTEAVIDALSYHSLFKNPSAIYLASGGGVSATQCELFISLLNETSKIKKVIIATDADSGGDRIAKRLLKVGRRSGFRGKICRHRPKNTGEDWNDVLCKA